MTPNKTCIKCGQVKVLAEFKLAKTNKDGRTGRCRACIAARDKELFVSKARTLEDRFWAKVDKTSSPNGCWLWTGGTNLKYGQISHNYKKLFTHRLSWTLIRGPIPDGLVIDHLCRNTICCNPEHLEPVTISENGLRGYSGPIGAAHQLAKTHCPAGHPYSGPNLYVYRGRRSCRTCATDRGRRYEIKRSVKRRAARAAKLGEVA